MVGKSNYDEGSKEKQSTPTVEVKVIDECVVLVSKWNRVCLINIEMVDRK
jgi:hypothetical protein